MTPAPRTPIRVGQIWERRTTGRQVRVTEHDTRNGVARLEPLAPGSRPSYSMEITLRRNYQLIEDVDR